MPLPKRPAIRKSDSSTPRAIADKTGDSRFASFETDPKFRLPSKKHAKTKLDPRFSRIKSDPDFYNKASVDRYGRPVSKDAGKKELERMYELNDEEDELELDAPKQRKRDIAVLKELNRVRQQGFDPIRDGGLSSSSDESSSEDEEDLEEDVEDEAELADEKNEVPMGEVTRRIAAVNLDWDNIRATDIMAVASSFVPSDGKIESVVVYPSEFGMERMQREELEGPPREIFSSSATNKKQVANSGARNDESDSEEDEWKEDDLTQDDAGEDFDSKALRNYQLDRLRYFYAVITCSSLDVAKSIYDNMDGREYLASANFFDLRFIPDEVDFDADPRDECEQLPDGYKPNEFITGALSHSKVKLTWDADDTTRQEVQKRAFSRKELDENELQAYLGTDSSSSEEDEVNAAKADKVASLRAALGLEPAGKSQSKPKSSSKKERDSKRADGEMEITFTAGLSANGQKGAVFENEPEETTLEKYVRKQKERKARRKKKGLALKEGRDPDAEPVEGNIRKPEAEDDDPWADPFFGSDNEAAEATRAESKKAKKARKREEREKQEKESAAERANLELLMVDDEGSKVQHFDMNEIMKAEKARKKGKKGRKVKEAVVEDNFKMDTNDPRFAKLYESHEFAIDPTNPRFQGTSAMKALLEEGRKKRKRERDDDEHEQIKISKQESGTGHDLKKLAAQVKAKSKSS